MKKLVTVLLALAMAFTMVFATAASAEDGWRRALHGGRRLHRLSDA